MLTGKKYPLFQTFGAHCIIQPARCEIFFTIKNARPAVL
jgi:hypothetical protein